MRTLCLVAILSLLSNAAQAGEFNQKLNIGDAAPTWDNLPATDGKNHSLKELAGKDVVVLAFTCLSCDYAKDYETRINELASKHATPDSKVAVVGVCVNAIPADRLDKLTSRSKEKEFAFPIMYDESQKIAHEYGAINTPEFYVLNKDRKIVYMGAFDDSAQDQNKVKNHYVEDAIAATLKGDPPSVKETVSVGCQIRWARRKRGE